jgi:outer membrane protein assembly factor BamB
VNGKTLVYAGSGRGATAVKIEKGTDGFVGKELWSNTEKSVQFNTPVLNNGLLFGLTLGNEFFCINSKNGQMAWTAPAAPAAATATPPTAPPPGGGGGRGGRGMGGGGGFVSIVDAGPVLVALTPSSELIVFQPSDKAYTELARFKVADTQTRAHPVLSGNRVFIKDKDSVILWTIE